MCYFLITLTKRDRPMFTASFSYKEEYSRLISAVLLDVIEGSRQGDLSLAEAIGLDLNSVKTLNSLKAEQLHTLSRTYSQYKKGHSLFNIDTSRIRNIIAAAATESEILETIDQYILYGASNSIIEELFGYTSIQIATRKKVLGIKTPKGPKKQISPAEKKTYL